RGRTDAQGGVADGRGSGEMTGGLENLDGLGLAKLVRDGEITPAEVLEATIARIEVRNPALNAIVTPMFEAAREAVAAGLPDGPFRGVPYAFKELVVSVKGAPTTSASRLYAGAPATADSEL